MTQITRDDILSEIAQALKAMDIARPSRDEGWRSMDELVKEYGGSESVIRRKMHKLNGRVEKQRFTNLMYYRIKP